MFGYNYGSKSNEQLLTCHKDLQKVFNLVIKRTAVDFGIHEGGRTVAKQQEYFDDGKSRVNPSSYPSEEALAKKGNHIVIEGHEIYGKSRALDLHVTERFNGKSLAWDDVHLAMVAGVVISCAQELYEKGEIEHLIRWGGNWDSDGIIALDQRLKDMPHFELIKP